MEEMKLPYQTTVILYAQSGKVIDSWTTPYGVHIDNNGLCSFKDQYGRPMRIANGLIVTIQDKPAKASALELPTDFIK